MNFFTIFFIVGCGNPPQIPRATITGGPNAVGSIRSYVCDPDTEGKGNPKIECLPSGMWSKTNLRCRSTFVTLHLGWIMCIPVLHMPNASSNYFTFVYSHNENISAIHLMFRVLSNSDMIAFMSLKKTIP